MDIMIQSVVEVMQPLNLILVIIGTIFGMVCGSLPGLSSSMAIILVLPFTYSMEPVTGILLLIAVYVGGACGGSISAILLKTPGTPEAVATTFDGYPMAMKGDAGLALGLAVSASSFGTIFSAFVMLFTAPLLAVLALKFQSAEYFALGLVGLSCITSLGAKNQLKAIVSVILGLMFATIGIDPINGAERFTFGEPFLMNGINYIAVMIGAFAVAEVYKNVEELSHRDTSTITNAKVSLVLMKFKDMLKMWSTFLKSSIIGTIIGIIPAAGGSIASLIAYGEAVRSSKEPEEFGKGKPEGIIAPEASNNAAVGGSMVPTMVLGIPGSPTAAVIMAAFMILGLRPGPLLIRDQPLLLNSIFIGLIIASILLFVGGRFVTREFARILKLPYPMLGTLIVALGVVGAYSLQNSFYDVVIMFAFGFVGYFFHKFQYSSSAFILGLILGGIIENSLRKQIVIGNGTWTGFLNRPLALLILAIALITFMSPLITNLRRKAKSAFQN
ncbi:putative tricarboxylic transport membrane protein [Acidaminobacter hydrogenoformans DSM 2784]|uniref:Putative tricarboxylic transport membrane protein n=2 Tax=Acidaminobacter TaxID=65402 RepID=A0A1G5S074_9FIRM|nr:putative tricarboxylic transport membrane protein [Acidaminobacter hydrogenoformans DSM 2784]